MSESRNIPMGKAGLDDQAIAAELLINAKAGIVNSAGVLVDSASADVLGEMKDQLKDAINIHADISNYMVDMGYYRAYDPGDQISMDIEAAQNIMNMKLTNWPELI
ncbi:MAG: spore coat protein [Clostridia bacterium]|nr:spore coat protein [Clostridia bacterium]